MSWLLSLYIVAVAASTHKEAACGVTFDVPHSWYAAEKRVPQQDTCVVTIRPRDWVATIAPGQPELTSTVRVTVTSEPFSRAAARAGLEQRADGAWELRSAGSAHAARAITAGAFRGLDVPDANDAGAAHVTLLDNGKGSSVQIESGSGAEQAHALLLSSISVAPTQ